jgi:pyruvate,water dikinase
LNLVQCRPFQVQVDIDGSLAQPGESLSAEDMVLESCGPVIGPGLATDIDRVVYVVPEEYAKLPVQSRYAVARLIGQITHLEGAEKRQNIMLIGPGRWGTRSPSLGVPVRFAEISRATVLCELALMHAGLVPDVSLGTHFFNDLVEMGMICLAVFPERQHNCFNQDVLERAANRLLELLPEASEWAHVLRVVDGDRLGVGKRLYLRADPMRQEAACYVAQADAARK